MNHTKDNSKDKAPLVFTQLPFRPFVIGLEALKTSTETIA